MTLVAISYSSEMLESLHMGSGASVANVLSVDLSVLGFLWWNYLARTLSFFSPSFAFCAVQMKKLHWLFLGCGPALLSDGCPLEGDCGVLGKGDEDADQPMISPAAAYFLGVVLSKKKEGKKYSTFFFFIFFYPIYNLFPSHPLSHGHSPPPAPSLTFCALRRDEWTSFPRTTHLSVTGTPGRRGHWGRIRPLPLNVAHIHKQAEAEKERVGRVGSKGEKKLREYRWGRAFPGEWKRILSNWDESRLG